MTLQEIFLLIICTAVFFIAIFYIRAYLDEKDLNSVFITWLYENRIVSVPILVFIVLLPLYLWINSVITYMRPGVEEVYKDFRAYPEKWEFKKQKAKSKNK